MIKIEPCLQLMCYDDHIPLMVTTYEAKPLGIDVLPSPFLKPNYFHANAVQNGWDMRFSYFENVFMLHRS